MENQIRYLETGSVNPYYNLAFEEYILRNRTEGDYIILWQNDNTIVVGQNQNTEEEINRQYVNEHKINVVRRMTGGGTVYHDLGNLNYSFITDVNLDEDITPQKFMFPIIEALKKMGINAEASGRNDILIDGSKISGTAQRVVGKRILHHGTLLFDSNMEVLSKALKVDPDKYKSKGIKSVRSRVTNISEALEKKIGIFEFWQSLKCCLLAENFIEDMISKEEQEEIVCLKIKKYDTWEWNYGYSPQYTVRNKQRWSGGSLEVGLSIKEGKIEEINFFGDYLSFRSTKDIEKALRGCTFKRAEAANILHQFRMKEYFGNISVDEILNTIFM